MWLRASVMLAFAVVLIVVQMFASTTAGQRFGGLPADEGVTAAILGRSVAAQDDDDNDNNGNDNEQDGNDNEQDDDGDDDDTGDGDNGEAEGDDDEGDGDNGEGDDDDEDDDDEDDDNDNNDDENDDDDNDNSDDEDDDSDDNDNGDDVDDNDNEPVPGIEVGPAIRVADATPVPTPIPVTPTATPRPTRTPTPTPVPTTEDQAITTGGELQVSLTGDRVVVQIFSTTPSGIVLTLRLVDPVTHPGQPGTLAGDLLFQIEARDQQGAILSALPADVNLSVRYTESDVVGIDDTSVTLARFDPIDGQWKTAPQLLTDPETNFVAASIRDLGVYAVYVP